MSGELWWGEHKSLTITGAKTILGLDALHAGKYVAILEGGGDLLAFFSSGRHSSHSPICSLGSTHKPRSDLIEMFHYILMWNLVTIYQHNDEAGRQMTKIWTEALRDTFCVLQVITFNSKE